MSKTKDYVYRQFAQELAGMIATKALADETQKLYDDTATLRDTLFDAYVKPHQKMLDKLPVGYLTKNDTFTVRATALEAAARNHYEERVGAVQQFTTTPDKYFMPDVLMLDAAHRLAVEELVVQRNDLKKRRESLTRELEVNIHAAESIDEIKTGWPEVADTVDDLATTYGVKFQNNLPRILGKHVKAVAAAVKKQVK
jgi:hypothetical protein